MKIRSVLGPVRAGGPTGFSSDRTCTVYRPSFRHVALSRLARAAGNERCTCWKAAAFPCWLSTRPCISGGATTSARITKSPARPGQLKVERVLAATATATPTVAADITRSSASPRMTWCTGFYRPNLNLRVARAPPGALELLSRVEQRGRAWWCVTLQRTAEEVAQALCKRFYRQATMPGWTPVRQRAGCVHGLGPADRGGDHRVRHGRGQGEHTLRLSLQPAQSWSYAGGRTGRAGWSARDLRVVGLRTDICGNFSYGDTPTPGVARR